MRALIGAGTPWAAAELPWLIADEHARAAGGPMTGDGSAAPAALAIITVARRWRLINRLAAYCDLFFTEKSLRTMTDQNLIPLSGRFGREVRATLKDAVELMTAMGLVA